MASFVYIFLVFFIGGVSSAYFCPKGTIPSNLNNSTCYEFITTPSSFQNAEIQCNNYGGHLVSIESGFDNSFIVRKLNIILNLTFLFF